MWDLIHVHHVQWSTMPTSGNKLYYRKIPPPCISPSEYKPPKLVTQKTLC